MNTYSIVLDYAGEQETAAEWAIKHNCSADVVNEQGPGGGWPEVKFSGKGTDLDDLINEYAGNDEELHFLRTQRVKTV